MDSNLDFVIKNAHYKAFTLLYLIISMNNFESIYILGQAAPTPPTGSPFGIFLPMVIMVIAMWFLVIAPQRKKQKKHQKMLSELKVGDKIITQGGIYGTIVSVKEDRYTVKVGEETRIQIMKSSIMDRESEPKSA